MIKNNCNQFIKYFLMCYKITWFSNHLPHYYDDGHNELEEGCFWLFKVLIWLFFTVPFVDFIYELSHAPVAIVEVLLLYLSALVSIFILLIFIFESSRLQLPVFIFIIFVALQGLFFALMLIELPFCLLNCLVM